MLWFTFVEGTLPPHALQNWYKEFILTKILLHTRSSSHRPDGCHNFKVDKITKDWYEISAFSARLRSPFSVNCEHIFASTGKLKLLQHGHTPVQTPTIFSLVSEQWTYYIRYTLVEDPWCWAICFLPFSTVVVPSARIPLRKHLEIGSCLGAQARILLH